MNKVIVEIGANKGQDTEKFLSEENVFVYSIEPVPQLVEELKTKFSDKTNLKLIQAAVSDYNGISKFGLSSAFADGIPSSMACSSLYDFVDNADKVWGESRKDFTMTEYIEVEVIRMDTLIERENIERIDFLHCDAQGADLKVLKSFGRHINKLMSGKCEVSNTVKLYKDSDNSWFYIKEFLLDNGFEITKITDHFGHKITEHQLPRSTQEIDVYFEKIKK
jgi:FkbM family methyltransferase